MSTCEKNHLNDFKDINFQVISVAPEIEDFFKKKTNFCVGSKLWPKIEKSLKWSTKCYLSFEFASKNEYS